MLKIKAFTLGPIGTNCYVAYDSDTKEGILIDPGSFNERIVDFIKQNNVTIKYTVNTHGHYDHIGGNKAFGYPVLIHEKDKGCFDNAIKNLSVMLGESLSLKSPHRLLKDKDEINVKGLSFRVIHTPGHTPGGITLECDNILFTGDTLFYEGVGRTDIPFANQLDLEKSLEKLMNYSDNTQVLPGHGPASTIGHERKNNPFLLYKD